MHIMPIIAISSQRRDRGDLHSVEVADSKMVKRLYVRKNEAIENCVAHQRNPFAFTSPFKSTRAQVCQRKSISISVNNHHNGSDRNERVAHNNNDKKTKNKSNTELRFNRQLWRHFYFLPSIAVHLHLHIYFRLGFFSIRRLLPLALSLSISVGISNVGLHSSVAPECVHDASTFN